MSAACDPRSPKQRKPHVEANSRSGSLRAILRHHRASASEIPARLLYSARTRADVIHRTELADYDTTITLTREQPHGWRGRTGRIDRDLLAEAAWSPASRPLVYLCGPTEFVEGVADALVSLGHEPSRIRAERFGPT
jgi:ferredoxin-NADP reductase